jgi:nucleoside-diphosphate-sugar epimerase
MSLIPKLIEAGHSVLGVTRTSSKGAAIAALGAEVAVADGLDRSQMRNVTLTANPEVIVHEMTALAAGSDLRHFDGTFKVTNLLRTRGLDHLLQAGREAGVKRFVAQSYCGWPYAREGAAVKSESDPLDPCPPAEMQSTLNAIRHLERTLTTETSLQGVVLRYGTFYGAGTGLLSEPAVKEILRRRFPVIGDGGGWWSFVHIDDAAAATALAVERGSPGIYNVVDDEPAPASEWIPALARILNAPPPRHVPKWLARLLAGEHLVAMMTESRAGSNFKAKREFHWRPRYASWRQGFEASVRTSQLARVS